MKASEIRKEARENLKGKWKKAVYIILVFFAISMLMRFVQGFFKEYSVIYNIINIVYLIINVPLSFGLIISFIKLKRGEEVLSFDFIKEGFSKFGKSWGIIWQIFIKFLLPIIIFIIIATLNPMAWLELLLLGSMIISMIISPKYVVLSSFVSIFSIFRPLYYNFSNIIVSYNNICDNKVFLICFII